LSINVPVNKQNLLMFKHRVKLLKSSHDILEDKYEGLRKQLENIILFFKREYDDVKNALEIAYRNLIETYVQNGKQNIKLIANFCESDFSFQIKKYSRFGVSLIDIIFPEETTFNIKLDYSLLDTTPQLEKTRRSFIDALKKICILATTENVLVRLSNEIKKIRKKISALENIIIPEYEEMIQKIQFILEEKERYEISIHKILKDKMGKK